MADRVGEIDDEAIKVSSIETDLTKTELLSDEQEIKHSSSTSTSPDVSVLVEDHSAGENESDVVDEEISKLRYDSSVDGDIASVGDGEELTKTNEHDSVSHVENELDIEEKSPSPKYSSHDNSDEPISDDDRVSELSDNDYKSTSSGDADLSETDDGGAQENSEDIDQFLEEKLSNSVNYGRHKPNKKSTGTWDVSVSCLEPPQQHEIPEDSDWTYEREVEPAYESKFNYPSMHPRVLSALVPEDEDLSKKEVDNLTLKMEDLMYHAKKKELHQTDKFNSHQEQLGILDGLQCTHEIIRHKFENSVSRKRNYRRLLERFDNAIFKAMKGEKDVALLNDLPLLVHENPEAVQCNCCDKQFHSERALQMHLGNCVMSTWKELMKHTVQLKLN